MGLAENCGSGLLNGRAVIVTGAAQGIGRAIASTLAASGASVMIADVNYASAQTTAAELVQEGLFASAVAADVTDEAQMISAVNQCLDRYRRLDAFVNNAGVARDATMLKMSLEQFRTVIDIHLQGCWLGTRAAASAMRKRGAGGSIVNISSTSGKTGIFGQTNYSAAKAGMVGLTKAAAKELARYNIRVNVIQPGLIRTPLTESLSKEIWDQKIAEVPLGRAGEPSEVGNVALFLASDLSSYMTGSVLEVHGGRFM
jgi:3-oxoacyl-[acyl-carrier protein] reductase